MSCEWCLLLKETRLKEAFAIKERIARNAESGRPTTRPQSEWRFLVAVIGDDPGRPLRTASCDAGSNW